MKFIKIELSQNKFSLVDSEYFDELSKFTWCFHHGYAVTHADKFSKNPGKLIYMHRIIMKPKKEFLVDHINGDTLDNRKENLRLCDHSGNMKNCKKPKDNTSGYKGVSFNKSANKWRAYISVDGKQKHLGLYDHVEDAARAYQVASKKYHKEFGRLS